METTDLLLKVGGNKRNAVRLYIMNMRLAQSLFPVIGILENALKNAFNNRLCKKLGDNWILDSINDGGIFYSDDFFGTRNEILSTIDKLRKYKIDINHNNIADNLDFGFWRHLFYKPVFIATGQCLVKAFPNKDIKDENGKLINHKYIYAELTYTNKLRNAIVHNEIICIQNGNVSVEQIEVEYNRIIKLLRWLGLETGTSLGGLDKVSALIGKFNRFMQNGLSKI